MGTVDGAEVECGGSQGQQRRVVEVVKALNLILAMTMLTLRWKLHSGDDWRISKWRDCGASRLGDGCGGGGDRGSWWRLID